MASGVPGTDTHDVGESDELRAHVTRALEERARTIVGEAASVSAFAGMDGLDHAERVHIIDLIVQLLTHAVRDGALDARRSTADDLDLVIGDTALDVHALFNIVYLLEQAALGELAADESLEATAERWPVITQMLRHASFDVCATLTEARDRRGSAVVDSLTSLYTRSFFAAAVEREIHRAERFGHPFALMLIDVDRLAAINDTHGYGAGDFVIERVGIVVRNYFRETDWVARWSGDAFAVLLPETPGADALRLGNRVRLMVQERLQLRDYRSTEQFPVTVSVGVLIAESVDRSVRADRLLADVEAAVGRAKHAGRNRVEHTEAVLGGPAPEAQGPSLD